MVENNLSTIGIGTPAYTRKHVIDFVNVVMQQEGVIIPDDNGTKWVTRAGYIMKEGFRTFESVKEGYYKCAFLAPPVYLDPCDKRDLKDWTPDLNKAIQKDSKFILPAQRVIIEGIFGVYLKNADKAEHGDIIVCQASGLWTKGGQLLAISPDAKIPAGYTITSARVYRSNNASSLWGEERPKDRVLVEVYNPHIFVAAASE